ncbi:uncharacterized protein LOC123530705 isoform X2 [Mercenaria mercenaria]|uniref:uncharacterized protein LOC123530705 isoform X2 n=1 Tax=Mercenaria mercenaria TaxID=6596 RepID=UPI00234F8421|nr:uncharacterized protein LOC123530705 isoform X2 [Mercenaria mercenaria]
MYTLSYIVILVFIRTPFCLTNKIVVLQRNASDTNDHCVVGFKHTEFDYTKKYCCEGSAIKSKLLGKKPCCTITTEVSCCDTRNISVNSLKKASCCKTVLYNIETEFCHNFVVNRRIDLQASTEKIHAATKVPFHNTAFKESSEYITYLVITCSVALVTVLVTFIAVLLLPQRKRNPSPGYVYIPSKISSYNKMERNNETRTKSHFETSFASGTISNDLETDGFENADKSDHHLLTQDETGPHNVILTDSLKTDLTVIEMETSSKRTQTEEEKDINVSNVMGGNFDRKHVFDKNNMSLVLPNSVVKLTLSKEDVSDGAIECYASTYRNLKQIYATFQSYMDEGEEIVSPTIEYYFPRNRRLKQFACVDMEYYSCSCNSVLKVWRFECKPEDGRVNERVQIPNRNTLNDIKNVDAYYEIISPGKIRIYLKRFCTLMCSVCNETHDCLSLTAHAYVVTVPCDGGSINVRVSLYILARVNQLTDYAYGIHQFVDANERQIVPKQKKICLPMNVQLEDDLSIRLKLWQESENIWQQRPFYGETDDTEYVQLHNIVDCPRRSSNGQPYSKEWYFVCNHGSIQIPKELVFNCFISINMVHPNPGVDTRQPPPNNFALSHVVDISSTKKTIDNQPPERGIIQSVAGNLRPLGVPIQESPSAFNIATGIAETDSNTTENRQDEMERAGILHSNSPAPFSPEIQANAITTRQRELQNFSQQGARPKQTKHHQPSNLNLRVQEHQAQQVNNERNSADKDAEQSQITVSDVNTLNQEPRFNPAEQVVRAETAEDSV